MWAGTYNRLEMCEGDYGIALPFAVSGAQLGNSDTLKFTFKQKRNGTTVLEKTYNGITNNTVYLEFTEAESALLVPGCYVFSLDWYQDGSFLCNIIENGILKVGDKA